MENDWLLALIRSPVLSECGGTDFFDRQGQRLMLWKEFLSWTCIFKTPTMQHPFSWFTEANL